MAEASGSARRLYVGGVDRRVKDGVVEAHVVSIASLQPNVFIGVVVEVEPVPTATSRTGACGLGLAANPVAGVSEQEPVEEFRFPVVDAGLLVPVSLPPASGSRLRPIVLVARRRRPWQPQSTGRGPAPPSPSRPTNQCRSSHAVVLPRWCDHRGEPFLLPGIGTIVGSCAALLPTTVLTIGMVFPGRGLGELESIPRDGVAWASKANAAQLFLCAWRAVIVSR